MSAVIVAAVAVFIVIALSFDSIAGMFKERAQLIQSYDVGSGGRFRLQELALGDLLKFPNGMGPFEFGARHGLQQHNVYLQAFLVYGWIGGMAYITLLMSTLWMALRTMFVRTPWQPYLICAFAAFVGEVLEGFVIDTDHWRHFFLLLGMVWGLAAATFNQFAAGKFRRRRDGSPMSALEFTNEPVSAGGGAAPCAGYGSVCRRAPAPKCCSMSAAYSPRCRIQIRAADFHSASPACSRPRAASAKVRGLPMPRSNAPVTRPPPSILAPPSARSSLPRPQSAAP